MGLMNNSIGAIKGQAAGSIRRRANFRLQGSQPPRPEIAVRGQRGSGAARTGEVREIAPEHQPPVGAIAADANDEGVFDGDSTELKL